MRQRLREENVKRVKGIRVNLHTGWEKLLWWREETKMMIFNREKINDGRKCCKEKSQFHEDRKRRWIREKWRTRERERERDDDDDDDLKHNFKGKEVKVLY